MEYLSLTSCIKNEGPHVQEWLAYYKSIGVEKFYIYNDRSTDDTEDNINDLSFRKDIVLIDYHTDNPNKQGLAFQRSKEHYGKNTEWMIYCDSDEFFMPSEPIDLRVFLQAYDNYSGLGAAWQIFGSSNHILRPPGLCLENYLYKAPEDWDPNFHVKTIVKPRDIIPKHTSTGYVTPHMWSTKNEIVDENGEIIDDKNEGRIPAVSIKKIRVNHYFNRSYEDWVDKRRRGRATIKEKRPIEMFDIYDRNDVRDDLALKYLDGVKKYL
jgi:hypothetical protein